MTVTDLAPIESAYSKYLGYAVVERGKVDAQTAATWGAPTVSGHDYMVMQPESGAPNYLRFVVTAPYPDYAPMRTYGWNSTEILVKDVDALAEKLKSSPFEIVGAPRNLSSSDQIKAMQVMGPAHEFLYLTTIKDPNHVRSARRRRSLRPAVHRHQRRPQHRGADQVLSRRAGRGGHQRRCRCA